MRIAESGMRNLILGCAVKGHESTDSAECGTAGLSVLWLKSPARAGANPSKDVAGAPKGLQPVDS